MSTQPRPASPVAGFFSSFLLSIALWAGSAEAQHVYATTAPVESAAVHRGQNTVSLGDFYYVGSERIELYRRADQLAVRLLPQFDSEDAVRGLTSANGALAGFEVTRDFGNGLRMFSSPALAAGATAPTRAYSTLRAAFSRLASEPNVASSAPVFVNAKLGTYAVATDEVVVRLKPGVDPAKFFADARFAGFERAPASDAFLARTAGGAGEPALALAAWLQGNPDIVWAEPNFFQERQKFFTPNDTLFSLQWHLNNTGQGGGTAGADAKLTTAWDIAGADGSDIVIAIVDDGPELAHPDLVVFNNAGETAADGIDNDGNGFIDDVRGWDFTSAGLGDNDGGSSVNADEHGTSVAGVAAARGNNAIGVTGAAYQATIFPSRIFLGPTPTSDVNIGAALAYASGRGRAPGDANWRGADIVNNSWGGGGPSSAINDALTWAATNGRGGLGTIHFFATGNSGAASISLPASLSTSIPSVIAVGASNNFDVRSSYSQFGPQIDFVAPSNGGSLGVVTTDRLGALGYNGYAPDNNYTNAFGGTSSATPLASGVGALLLSMDPSLTVMQVRALMRANADKIGPLSYDANGFNLQYGHGRINASRLVRAVDVARASVSLGTTAVVNGAPLLRPGLAGGTQTLSFTVRSSGELNLDLAALQISGDSEFEISAPFGASSVPLGQSTTFEVTFMAAQAGTYNATVSFTTNDPDNATFTVPLEVQVAPVSIGGSVFEDWNGNGTRDAGDPPLAGRTVYLDTNSSATYDAPVGTAFASPASLGQGFGAASTSHVLAASGLPNELQGLEVRVRLTHTYVGDVRLRLIAPDGRSVVLVSSPGGANNSADNMTDTVFADDAAIGIQSGTAPYTGRFRPEEPLGVLNGINPNGNWTLEASDRDPTADNGVLVNWTLTAFTGGEPSRSTPATGDYAFLSLPPGTYAVRTLTPAGWTSTGPFGGSHAVVVVGSETNSGRDFASVRQDAIYGRVYADVDVDGSYDDATDLLLDNEAVFLDANGNESFDPPVPVSITRTLTPALAIPDNNLAGVSDSLMTAEPGTIAALTVGVNVTHPFVGDLRLSLTAPNGVVIPLITRRGGSGDNFTNTVLDDSAAASISSIVSAGAPFTGSFRPEQPLATLLGLPGAGTWTLSVADAATADLGALNSWTLNLVLAPEQGRTTNGFGNFRFDPALGAVDLRLVVPPGFAIVQPAAGSYPLVLASGDTSFNRDFGISDNQAPSFTSVPVTDVLEDAVYSYSITLADPNAGDALTLSAPVLPSWLTLTQGAPGSRSGTLSGTPTNADVGTHDVTLRVSDGIAAPVDQVFQIVVGNTNDAPTVVTPISDRTDDEGATISASVAGNFADADAGEILTYSADLLPPGLSIDTAGLITGTILFTADPSYTVTITADDGNGGTVSDSFVWTVTDINRAPTITGEPYAFPVDAAAAVSTVVGTVTASDQDAADALAFTLGSGNTDGAFAIDSTTGTITVANSSALTFGASFELTVTVSDGKGLDDSTVVSITVIGGAPVGEYIFEDGFED